VTSSLNAAAGNCAGGALLPCLDLLYKLAPSFQGTMNFIYTDGVHFRPFMERLGLSKLPGLVILDWSQEKHYVFESSQNFTRENLERAFSDFFAHRLAHVVRSAPPSESREPASTDLVHVVSDNFQELVLDSPKNVLVNFHLPWCGFSKSVWPAYEKLAEISSSDDVIIADLDASTNDAPRELAPADWPAQFPHIALFPSQNKTSAVAMKENPSLENLVKFLQDNIVGFTVNLDSS